MKQILLKKFSDWIEIYEQELIYSKKKAVSTRRTEKVHLGHLKKIYEGK